MRQAKPIDFLEQARRIWKKGLPRLLLRRPRKTSISLPRAAVCLTGHVRKRIQPVVGLECDLVNRNVLSGPPFAVKNTAVIDIPIRWRVKLRCVILERMRTKLFDIERHRRRKPLRAKGIITKRVTVSGADRGQAMRRTGLIAGE